MPLSTENETDTKTTAYTSGRVLDARREDGRRRRAARTRQPQGQDSDEGLSKKETFGIIFGCSAVAATAFVGYFSLSSGRTPTPGTTTPGTTTPGTTISSRTAEIIQSVDINQGQSATPRSTTSSMTAETIGAGIQI